MKKTTTAAFVLMLVSAILSAQTTTQLNSCVAFNDEPTITTVPLLSCNSGAAMTFTAAANLFVTEIEVFGAANGYLCGAVLVPATGTTVSGTCVHAIFVDWHTIVLAAPVFVPGGALCTIAISPLIVPPASGASMNLQSNLVGTSPLTVTPYCITTAACSLGQPCTQPPFVANPMIRLRGPACTGGAPASVTMGGVGCGNPTPVLTSGFAVVGDYQFDILMQSVPLPGATAYLFVAEGSITAGVPVESNHPCAIYLNLANFAYLASLGYEPIASHPVNSSAYAFFEMPIPAAAFLIGARVTFQAAVVDPSGVPLATAPGVSILVSNALELTIGG